MKFRSCLFMLLVIVVLVLAACGGAPATRSPEVYYEPAATEAPAYEEPVEKQAEDQAVGAAELAPLPTAAAFEVSNASGDLTVIERSNRMIVKNADIRLMVKDTDVAIDRATQVIADAGGYIVSSRVWYQDYYGNNLKYATVTIGIPVDEFERALVRLR